MNFFKISFLVKVKLIAVFFLFISVVVNAQWSDYQNAALVVGQADFVTGTYGTTTTTVAQTVGVAVDNAHSKLYVCDHGNHRILRYDITTLVTGAAAERVFGQADFTSGTANRGGACAQNSLNNPCGIAIDASGRLWVADADNNRVVWYNAAYSTASNGVAADGVLGQTNYSNTTTGTTASTFNTVNQLSYLAVSSAGALYFSDISNHRILRFDGAAALTPGVNSANGVLGQADFTSSGSGITSSTFNYPSGIAFYGTGMFVADQQNNRVLRFDNPAAAANGAAANGVLGQVNFTSAGLATTQSGMNLPSDVSVDGAGRLYVADINNMRVLIFNGAAALADGANANNELGQVNFTTRVQAITQPGYWYPYGVHVNGGHLYVSDGAAARVLRYDPSSTLPVELVSFTATKENQKVELSWTTASEINSDYFQVLRSSDGVHFEKISREDALGYSNTLRNYTVIDDAPMAGINYYQLVEYDKDGATQKSKIVVINFEDDLDLITQMYPNPSPGKTALYFNSIKGGMYSLSISNVNGDVVYSARIMGIPGENKFSLSLENLSAGPYFINLVNPEQKKSSLKFMKSE